MQSAEEYLINAIFGEDVKGVKEKCLLMIELMKFNQNISKKIKLLVLRLILLLLGENNKLDFGDYLKDYSTDLASLLLNCYESAMNIEGLENFLFTLKVYNVVFKFLYNDNIPNVEYIYDFFLILKKNEEIKTIYQKYISRFTSGTGIIKCDITLKEFIEFINNSKCINDSQCLSESKCDYDKLSSYVYNFCSNKIQNQVEKNKKGNKNRKKQNKTKNKKKEEKEKNIIENEPNGNSQENNDTKTNSFSQISESKNNNIDDDVKNINDKNIIPYTQYMKYVLERKEFYQNKNIETPILNEIIEGKKKINLNLFILEKEKENMFDIHYANLERIVELFNDEKDICKEITDQNIGYVSHKLFRKKFEGIYAIIPNDLLFKEISDKTKFLRDEFEKENEKIVDNCLKARALSFEYYINSLLLKDFELINLPRVIFCFKNDTTNIKDIIELDGIFFFEKEQKLNLKNLPFIDEDIVKKNFNQKFAFEASDNSITFNENSLILLEIKSRFPSNDPKQKESLDNIIDPILDKVIVFYDLYKERFKSIKKVKLIFFYDSIRKKGYDKIISQKINNFIYYHKFLRDLFEFQIIFIASSFFAIGVKTLNDRTTFLEEKIKTLENENNELRDELSGYKMKTNKLEKKLDMFQRLVFDLKKDNEKLKKDNEKLKKDNEELKKGNEKLNCDIAIIMKDYREIKKKFEESEKKK